jgi:dephospho-CoA kinase
MGVKIPFQLGITGGIGSGKSLFARIFEVMGVPVYESDAEARALYLHPEIRTQVIQLIGLPAYLSDGRPDTGYIAGKIYSDFVLRESLNALIHPALAIHYRQWLEKQKHPFILKVAALLFEADIASQLDFTAVVVSPESLRKKRISQRDPQRSQDQIDSIIRSQWSDNEKIKRAGFIVKNDEENSLIEQAMELKKHVMSIISAGQ